MEENKSDIMELLIVTGMSGAGKSQAANVLEDIGFYCVDNVPPLIIPNFVELLSGENSDFKKLAIITDIRGGELFKDIIDILSHINRENISYKILFLTAEDDVLIRRYKENRRLHPLSSKNGITVSEAVTLERTMLKQVRDISDYVIDTSALSVSQFKERLTGLFTNELKTITVQCESFGFKYGVPSDADLVFDVRCLPNPFYVSELKKLTGTDSKVRDFVMSSDESRALFTKISELVGFLLPLYLKEGKSQLVVAFGCTGGKHRSVTFAELLNNELRAEKFNSITVHRDISKN